jgi:hypothetical protein
MPNGHAHVSASEGRFRPREMLGLNCLVCYRSFDCVKAVGPCACAGHI